MRGGKARERQVLVERNCVERKASMSIGNEGEENIPTHDELAASAEEQDRRDRLTSKARGRANQARAERSEVSEKDLLAK